MLEAFKAKGTAVYRPEIGMCLTCLKSNEMATMAGVEKEADRCWGWRIEAEHIKGLAFA